MDLIATECKCNTFQNRVNVTDGSMMYKEPTYGAYKTFQYYATAFFIN